VPGATWHARSPGTSGSAGCGTSCKRRPDVRSGHTCRDVRPEPQCGIARYDVRCQIALSILSLISSDSFYSMGSSITMNHCSCSRYSCHVRQMSGRAR
jgi:hypothetical protein